MPAGRPFVNPSGALPLDTLPESPWRLSHQYDPRAVALADRHYSRRKPGTPQFVPPGRKLVLLAADESALWVSSWPFPQFVRRDWRGAWINTLFRNERAEADGGYRSSDLIRWAVAHTRDHWSNDPVPDDGIISLVDEGKTGGKDKPGRHRVGWCYRKAGWTHVGFTRKEHLWVFQLAPAGLPGPVPVPGTQIPLALEY